MRFRGDTGQAMPLAIAVIVVAAILTIAFGSMAGDVIDAARAQTAADAAALASIEGGESGAAAIAGRHGGRLLSWSRSGAAVTVVVRIGDAIATARASGGALSTTADQGVARDRATSLPTLVARESVEPRRHHGRTRTGRARVDERGRTVVERPWLRRQRERSRSAQATVDHGVQGADARAGHVVRAWGVVDLGDTPVVGGRRGAARQPERIPTWGSAGS